jgi:ABC-type transport system substrate-binding protein
MSAIAIALLLALITAGTLAACGGDTRPTEGPSQSPQTQAPPALKPKAGGTLAVSYLAEPSTLDPALVQNVTERAVVHSVYQGLFRYAPEPEIDGAALTPCLAAELPTRMNGSVSADGRTYTIALRKGVRFQPPLNRSLEATDVKYSLERMMSLASAATRSQYKGIVGSERFLNGKAKGIAGIKVIDDLTLEIRLSQPDPSLLHALALEPAHIVAEEWVERRGNDFDREPLGTGPFVLLKWAEGKEITLVRNPSYWETGKPYVDGIAIDLTLSRSDALARLKSGAIDALGYGLSSDERLPLSTDPVWQGQLREGPLLAAAYLSMNMRKKPFDDVRVRRAVSWAIDREKLADLQSGSGQALWQYYPSSLPGHESGKTYHGFDRARARAALRKAGYPDGLTTTLHVPEGELNRTTLEALKADLAAVGIRVRLKTVSSDRYRRLLRDGDVTLGVIRWRADLPDPGDWMSAMYGEGGAGNASHWSDARIEALQDEADSLTDPEARLQEYQRLQRDVAAGAPYVPLFTPLQTAVSSRNMEGFYLHPVYQLDLANYWKK